MTSWTEVTSLSWVRDADGAKSPIVTHRNPSQQSNHKGGADPPHNLHCHQQTVFFWRVERLASWFWKWDLNQRHRAAAVGENDRKQTQLTVTNNAFSLMKSSFYSAKVGECFGGFYLYKPEQQKRRVAVSRWKKTWSEIPKHFRFQERTCLKTKTFHKVCRNKQ